MTTFGSTLTDSTRLATPVAIANQGISATLPFSDVDPEERQRQRQQQTDALIEQNRAATNPDDIEKRQVQRLSVAELNDLDLDAIARRLSQTRFDDRPPIVRALDLLDLPRNALFNLAAPGIAEKRRNEGDVAAFGLPRVMGSDILEEAGVENRVVRAIAGFVGDVALDPLTYAGPAGVGFKLSARTAGGARQTLQISKGGRKKIIGGIRAAAKAGTPDAIQDETVRNLVKVAVPNFDDLRKLKPDEIEGELRKRLIGDIRQSPARRFLPGREADEGLIARRFFDVADEAGEQAAREIDAVRQFVGKAERSATGLRIGRGGTQLAHIPFTGVNVQVPAFTAAGRTSIAVQGISRAAAFVPEAAEAVRDVTQRTERLLDAVQAEARSISAERTRFADETNQVRQLEEAGDTVTAESLRFGFETERRARVAQRTAELENIEELAGALTERIRALGVPNTIPGVLVLNKLKDLAVTTLDRAEALRVAVNAGAVEGDLVPRLTAASSRIAQASEEARIAASVAPEAVSGAGFNAIPALSPDAGDAAEFLDQATNAMHRAIETSRRISDEVDGTIRQFMTPAEREMLETVKASLGTNDDTIGASLLMPFESAAKWALGEDSTALSMVRSADRATRTIFGRRSGELHAVVRFYERGRGQAQQRAAAATANALNRAIESIGETHDLKPDQLDELRSVMTAALYANRSAPEQTFYREVWIPGRGPVSPDEAIKIARETGEDMPIDHFTLRLIESERSGVLSNPEVRASVDQVVNDLGAQLLDDMKEVAVESGLLGVPMAAYVPSILTREGSQAVRTRRRALTRASSSEGAADALTAKERFQKSRSTTQYRYQDPETGQWKRFFEFERAYLSFGEASTTPEVQNIVDTITRYDELVKAGRIADEGRPTDIFELNALIKNGHFSMLTGNAPLPTGFFESNIVSIMAARSAMHERAVARQTLVRFGRTAGASVSINPQEVDAVRGQPGAALTTRTGETVHIARDRVRGLDTISVGGRLYRQLDDAIIDKNNPLRRMLEGLDPEAPSTRADLSPSVLRDNERFYEESVADAFERAGRYYEEGPDANALFELSDWITSRWKETTLLHPSWMLTELIGNATLWLMGGVRIGDITRHFTKVSRLVMAEGNPEKLRQMQFRVGGQTIDGETLLNQAFDTYADASRGAEHAAMTNIHLGVPLPRRQPGESLPQTIKASLTSRRMFERGSTAVGDGVTPFNDSMWRRVIAPWFRADAKLNNAMRITAYLSFLEQGFDASTAARKTIETMFDMTDLTRFESNVARRFLLPFYSWIRNNTAYQVKQLFHRPVYAANFPRLRDALEEAINGEDQVPRYARPRWMREQLAMQIGRDPEKRWSILLRSGLPIGDVFETLAATQGVDGAQDFFQYMIGSGNPVWKVPIEIAAGREIFSRREIGPSAEEGDISVKDFLLSQARPIRETGVGLDRPGPLTREFRRGPAAGASRLLAGGRSQAFDEDRLRSTLVREFNDRQRRIRAAINRAQRDGDEQTSQRARVRLMSLFQRMIEIGLQDEVPKWAREQLNEIEEAQIQTPQEI